MRRPLNLAATTVAFMLLAAACSDSSTPSTTLSPTTTEPETTQSTASVESTSAEDTLEVGSGVDPETKTITLGLLADQTGLFSSLEADIVAAQSVYWDDLNAAGGIEGWTVQYVVEDTASNRAEHLEKYQEIRDDVLAISHPVAGAPMSNAPAHVNSNTERYLARSSYATRAEI